MNGAESYFEDLLMRVIEGCASEEEFATFTEIIRLDAELRRRYTREMRLHALLSCLGEGSAVDRKVLKRGSPQRAWWKLDAANMRTEVGSRRRFRCWLKMVAAAALLLSGAAVWHWDEIMCVREKRGDAGEGAAEFAVPFVRVMGQKNVSGLNLPETLPGTLRLESGEVRVRLQTGVELIVFGPADVVVQNGLRVSMDYGRLLANVPHWTTGFIVRTRDLEVCDLGTVFSVNAAEEKSDVFVFKGSVQVSEAGYSEFEAECAGADVGICGAGEGVRSVAGERPQKIAADWPVAQRMFASVKSGQALLNPTKALETATEIADLWAERYMPGSSLVAKKMQIGNGIPFQNTAWVRASVPQQEGNNMNRASVASIMTAAAVMMGAGKAGAVSDPVSVNFSPHQNRYWTTVLTNEVPLKWDWCPTADRAELEIVGMSGVFTTNFFANTSNYVWQAFTGSYPERDDSYTLTLRFYNGSDALVGAMTSQLAVVAGAFGKAVVDPGPAEKKWTTVRDNVVIPYDSRWAAATADAASSRLVIRKVGGLSQTNAFSDATGYYGWKLKHGDWGYGTFNLALTFPGAEGEWNATVNYLPNGTTIWVR